MLWGFWLLLGWWERRRGVEESLCRLRAFVGAAVVVSLCGAAVNALVFVDRALAASLLRLYWFRLTDVALPLGVALEGVGLLAAASAGVRGNSRRLLAAGYFVVVGWLLVLGLAASQVGGHVMERIAPGPPRGDNKMADAADWRAACRWVAESGKIPPSACFLVPRGLADVRLVHRPWRRGHLEGRASGTPSRLPGLVGGGGGWRASMRPASPALAVVSVAEFQECETARPTGAKYYAGYLITERTDPLLELEMVYGNRAYVIYRL